MMTKRIKSIIGLALGSVVLLTACDVKDPIYDPHMTEHPEHGKITLTTDWTERGEDIDVPASYTVRVGDWSQTLSGTTNTLDELFDPGQYTVYAYNTAEHVAVSGTTVTVETINPPVLGVTGRFVYAVPGWQFTGKKTVDVEADAIQALTIRMDQQLREITLLIDPQGGSVDRIESIRAFLSGVAGEWEIDNDSPSGQACNVNMDFTKITSGENAGKWTATVRLLGVTGQQQKLTGTITFTDGNPAYITLNSDLSVDLSNFNTEKKTPLTLGGQIVETPTEAGFTATIEAWKPVSGGSGTAN